MQLEGIKFPSATREQGGSVELLKFDSVDVSSWAKENMLEGDRQWGIISQAKSKDEDLFLSLSFRRVERTRLKLQNGRIERVQEEATEPEIGEFHFRGDGLLELYSLSAKQKSALTQSIRESFGENSIGQLYLSKDAMKSLMVEAIEVSSVSLSGLGNPFFNDATLSGTDPVNSKTYKDLVGSGEIRSFRAKFQGASTEASGAPLIVTVHSNCKLRFFGGKSPVAQEDIEDFAKKVASIAGEPENYA